MGGDAPRTILDQPLVSTPEEIRSAQITIVEFCEAHEVSRDDLILLLDMVTGKPPEPETKDQLRKRRVAARKPGVKTEEYERIPVRNSKGEIIA